MGVSKWKSISEWKPATFTLSQMVDFLCEHRDPCLPKEIQQQIRVTVTRERPVTVQTRKGGLFKSQVSQETHYQEEKQVYSLDQISLYVSYESKIRAELQSHPHLKAIARMLQQSITDMVARSDDAPVPIESIAKEWRSAICYMDHPGNAMSSIWLFKGNIYLLSDKRVYSIEEAQLLILECYDKDRRKWEQLKRKYGSDPTEESSYRRERIPEEVRIAVWRRDDGKCARCGSREKLEYDHIVPVSKGGGNTARNIELLCESCNRKKSNNIE